MQEENLFQNKQGISKGLTPLSAIKASPTVFGSKSKQHKIKIAPKNGVNQNVCIWNLPIFSVGKKITQTIIPTIDSEVINNTQTTTLKYTSFKLLNKYKNDEY